MKTEEEVKQKIQEDLQFIISAVTSTLHDMAYLKYFVAWENNGGMGWFFSECVDITHEIMLTEGSAYLKWLEHWKEMEDNTCESFSEITGETCFDWYHMIEARKLFMSMYEEDECSKVQISERMGYLLNSFKVDVDRDAVMSMAVKFAKKERDRIIGTVNDPRVQQVIDTLNELDVDGESMEYIIEKVGMTDQMVKQLYFDKRNM
jgi:hypothetical protein